MKKILLLIVFVLATLVAFTAPKLLSFIPGAISTLLGGFVAGLAIAKYIRMRRK